MKQPLESHRNPVLANAMSTLIEVVEKVTGHCELDTCLNQSSNENSETVQIVRVGKAKFLVCDKCLPRFILDNSEEQQLVSVNGVARLLDVSPRTVWRMLSAGEIAEPVRLRGATRWRREDIERWIAARCPTVNNDERYRRANATN